jgi:hypothetical protein
MNDEVTVKQPLIKGGEDFGYCTKLFLDKLELKNLSFHTRRWHKENNFNTYSTLGWIIVKRYGRMYIQI